MSSPTFMSCSRLVRDFRCFTAAWKFGIRPSASQATWKQQGQGIREGSVNQQSASTCFNGFNLFHPFSLFCSAVESAISRPLHQLLKVLSVNPTAFPACCSISGCPLPSWEASAAAFVYCNTAGTRRDLNHKRTVV